MSSAQLFVLANVRVARTVAFVVVSVSQMEYYFRGADGSPGAVSGTESLPAAPSQWAGAELDPRARAPPVAWASTNRIRRRPPERPSWHRPARPGPAPLEARFGPPPLRPIGCSFRPAEREGLEGGRRGPSAVGGLDGNEVSGTKLVHEPSGAVCRPGPAPRRVRSSGGRRKQLAAGGQSACALPASGLAGAGPITPGAAWGHFSPGRRDGLFGGVESCARDHFAGKQETRVCSDNIEAAEGRSGASGGRRGRGANERALWGPHCGLPACLREPIRLDSPQFCRHRSQIDDLRAGIQRRCGQTKAGQGGTLDPVPPPDDGINPDRGLGAHRRRHRRRRRRRQEEQAAANVRLALRPEEWARGQGEGEILIRFGKRRLGPWEAPYRASCDHVTRWAC